MKRNCGSLLDPLGRFFILIHRFNILPIIPHRCNNGLSDALLGVQALVRALVYFIGILSTFLRPGRQAEAAVGAGGFFGVQNMDVAGQQAGLKAIHDRFQEGEAGKNDT